MFTKKWLFILLIPCCLAVFGQTPPITGLVKDEQGTLLPNVNVKLQNLSRSFISKTDTNGVFQFINIPVANDYTITFTCVGFETYTIKDYTVNPQSLSTIAVKLKRNFIELAPVLVVGYGSAFKKDISTAIASLKPEDFNTGVITNPAQMMQGRIAGLNITADGNPNGVPAVILRGPSTLNLSQQPFYVIDGIPDASVNLISPADIASVEVLKDAAASAIYGNRAANGVILITTRKGKPGDLRITYNGFASVQNISNFISVATADELRGYLKANNKALAPSDDNGANTNWQKQVNRTGYAQNHNIGFSNGSNNFTYSGSVNYFNDIPIIKGSSLQKFTARFNLEQKALNNLIKFKFSVYDLVSRQTDVDTLVFYNVLRFLPTLKVFNIDGTYREDLTRTQTYNPLALIENNQYETKINSLLGNGGIEVKLPLNITYNLALSYQSVTTNANSYNNRYSLLAYNTNGQAIRSTYENTKQVLETYFTYNTDIATNHHLNFLLGYSWQQDSNGDGFQTSNVNFPSDATSYYNLSLGQAPAGYVPLYGNVSIETLRLISFFSRVNYNYHDRFLFQGSLRRDGSSAFGVKHRWGYFPSVSAAWQLGEERFMKGQHIFSDVKLRLGYGVAGNTIGFDPLTPLLLNNSTGSFYYNGSFIKSIGPVQNPNPNLQWEKTAQLDAGIDIGILNNRVNATVDLYSKTTSDIIYNYQQPVPLSYTSGNSVYANAGEMSNNGIEITINANLLNSGNLNCNTAFNIAHNKNKVLSLSNDLYKINYIYTAYPNGTGQSNTSTQIIKAGYPVGQFYTLHYLGKNANGISMFEDINGKPTITPTSADQRYLGNAQPQYIYGWSNTLKYKKFDLSVFFRGVLGNRILNATLATLNSPSDASNHNIPKLTLSEPYNDYNASLYSDRYLESGSYLRLENVALGYKVISAGKYVHSLKIYLTGSDLFTITGYTGIDPEISIGTITPGVDNHNYYPKTRSFIAGVTMEL